MNCPKCDGASIVEASIFSFSGNSRYRRRYCPSCQEVFYTEETISKKANFAFHAEQSERAK